MIPAATAIEPAAESAVKVLTTDLVSLEGKIYRRVIKKIPLVKNGVVQLTRKGRVRYVKVQELEPIQVSAHANPIGLGALGALVGIGGALLFGRVRVGVIGIGTVELYKGPLADEWDAWKVRVQTERTIKKQSTPGTPEHELACQLVREEFDRYVELARDQPQAIELARAVWDGARASQCDWTAEVPRP